MRSEPEWPGGFYCLWLSNETPHKLGMRLGSAQNRGPTLLATSRPLPSLLLCLPHTPALCPHLGDPVPVSGQARSPGGDALALERRLPLGPCILLLGVLYSVQTRAPWSALAGPPSIPGPQLDPRVPQEPQAPAK